MADIVTSFFLAPVASRVAATATKALAPSALELGAETLNRNPFAETVARLFSPASSAGLISGVDSFLAVQSANQNSAAPSKTSLKSSTGISTPDRGAPDLSALFGRRETGAALRLKQLLNPSAAQTAGAAASAAGSGKGASPPAAPAVSRNTLLRVAEGESAALSAKKLQSSDGTTNARNIVYTLEDDGPRHGRLEYASKPGETITRFTQEDIDLQRVRYVNDGSESSADSFRFSVSNGSSESRGTFSIAIAAVNDAPELTVNAPLSVDEGGSGGITAASLSARDADGIAATTAFEIESGPRFGYIAVDGVAATRFTQADLLANRVSYVNDGSEETSDSFSFRVSDGSAGSALQQFSIAVNPVDDAPATFTNTGASLAEGGRTTINSAQLGISDVDTAPADITFTVTGAPLHGQLEFSDNQGVAISSFTQEDLDAGRVQYVHDGSETTADSFAFTVADQSNVLQQDSFALSVSPVDDAPELAVNARLGVLEGGTAAITTSALALADPDTAAGALTYSVTSGPAHGRLEFSDNAGSAVTTFTQDDLESGRLRYVHDGSETTADAFSFVAGDGTTALSAATFGIDVTPVNDAPTLVNTGGTVAENGTHTISLSELRATDPDTASSQLVFTVTGSTNGRVESSANPGVALASFTQDDIAAGRVRFVQNGAESASAGFTFSLSDGTATLGGNSFDLAVTPVNDTPFSSVNTGATVARQSTTIISSARLRYSDPDNTDAQLVYTIASPASRGRLELTTNPGVSVTSFTQADLDAGLLRYVHTASGRAADSFTFRVSDGTATTTTATFSIAVQ